MLPEEVQRARVQSDVHACRATCMALASVQSEQSALVTVPGRTSSYRMACCAAASAPLGLNFKYLSAKQRYDQAFCLDLQ